MHPAVQQFSQRRPRLYGLLSVIAALLFALGSQIDEIAFPALLLSVACGVNGILYLIFGAKCVAWNAKFVASFDPQRISWRQALVLCGWGLVLLVLTLILNWLIR